MSVSSRLFIFIKLNIDWELCEFILYIWEIKDDRSQADELVSNNAKKPTYEKTINRTDNFIFQINICTM